jgi:hypothetical protein
MAFPALDVLSNHNRKARRLKMDIASRQAAAQARRCGKHYYGSLLAEDHIHQAVGRARQLWEGWIYTPAKAVFAFLAQCLGLNHSYRDAEAKLSAWLAESGPEGCSAEREYQSQSGRLLATTWPKTRGILVVGELALRSRAHSEIKHLVCSRLCRKGEMKKGPPQADGEDPSMDW